jgi:hypothetical protein
MFHKRASFSLTRFTSNLCQTAVCFDFKILIVFSVLAAPLIIINLCLILGQHLPAHDTLGQNLFYQYLVFNDVALKGKIPLWCPFIAHGIDYSLQAVPSNILLSLLSPLAHFFKMFNFLSIFYISILFDEMVLLLGCVLLSRRYFKSLATIIFVSATLTYTTIASWQISLDFHIVYLLPLILYSLDRALRDTSAKYLFLTGLFGLAAFLGNAPYLVPFIAFSICVFGIFLFFFEPFDKTYLVINIFRQKLSWRHALVLLFLGYLATDVALYMRKAIAQLAFSSAGRDMESGLVAVETFLTYGSITMRDRIGVLIWNASNHDVTFYMGMMTIPFIAVALWRVRSRLSYAFGATGLALTLFGFGTLVSLVFYYVFPTGSTFRHIAYTFQVAKLFLVFYAGFGFEVFWNIIRSMSHSKKQKREWKDRLTLLIPVGFLGTLLVVLLSVRLNFPFSKWYSNVTWIKTASALDWQLVIMAGMLILLLTIVRWPRQILIVGCLLLTMHTLDVLGLKIEREYIRSPKVNKEIIDLFKVYDYGFEPERNQDYYSNVRFRVLAPYMLGNSKVKEDRPVGFAGRYGAFYSSIDAFIFKDTVASVFRNDTLQKNVDAFHRAWRPSAQYFPGFPIPEAIAYRKLSGYGYPKLQVFSRIHILPDDRVVARVLAHPYFKGDMLFVSELDIMQLHLDPKLLVKQVNIPIASNDRLTGAVASVEGFSFDTLRLQVNNTATVPSILYYADAWHPDWQTFVNGKIAEVIRTNIGYKSVVVPPGKSTVLFQFGTLFSRGLLYGVLLIGILAFCGIIYLFTHDLLYTLRIDSKCTTPSYPTVSDKWALPQRNARWCNLNVIKRTAILFSSSCFSAQVLLFEVKTLWPDLIQISIVTPFLIMGVITIISYISALISYPKQETYVVRVAITVGLLSGLAAASLFIIIRYSIMQVSSTNQSFLYSLILVHVLILYVIDWVNVKFQNLKLVEMVGVFVFILAWLGTPVIPWLK